jgi:hypothetical protein
MGLQSYLPRLNPSNRRPPGVSRKGLPSDWATFVRIDEGIGASRTFISLEVGKSALKR